MSTNTITAVGNLVGEPELRFTNTGMPVVNARVAVTERVNRQGEWVDRTNFVNIVAWRGLAENMARSLNKGSRIMFTGRLQVREYDAENGERRYFTEVVVDEVGVALRFHAVHEIEKSTPALVGAGAPVDVDYGPESEPF